jgi:hypothetical protein
MGLEFKLTDHELPISPVFIRFLAQALSGRPFDGENWAEQRSEALSPNDRDPRAESGAVAMVMGSEMGRERLTRAYTLLFALLTGDLAPLHDLQSRYHFVSFVGIPRTGGSYLTAELFRALGMQPERVANGLAHDSFPEAGPFQLQDGINSWVMSMKTMAEYLTMVETCFGDRKPHSGKIVVPKKLTKSAYSGGFFHHVFGEQAEYVLTVRHPVASCVSTYEKSGGLPADGRFVVRSNIEEWCRRDLRYLGCGAELIENMDYFDAYLRYWEQYQLSVALTGLSASRNLRVVAFGKAELEACARAYHDRYSSGLQASEFQVSEKARRLHPDWIERACPAIDRVEAAWKLAGLRFPIEKICEVW